MIVSIKSAIAVIGGRRWGNIDGCVCVWDEKKGVRGCGGSLW